MLGISSRWSRLCDSMEGSSNWSACCRQVRTISRPRRDFVGGENRSEPSSTSSNIGSLCTYTLQSLIGMTGRKLNTDLAVTTRLNLFLGLYSQELTGADNVQPNGFIKTRYYEADCWGVRIFA
ncbi:hypothetical protein FRC03_004539 [Tulasnella sp. 419]|nr:hypothetical protein FRC03_004539 [Tulasnella sp. 419]